MCACVPSVRARVFVCMSCFRVCSFVLFWDLGYLGVSLSSSHDSSPPLRWTQREPSQREEDHRSTHKRRVVRAQRDNGGRQRAGGSGGEGLRGSHQGGAKAQHRQGQTDTTTENATGHLERTEAAPRGGPRWGLSAVNHPR